MLLPGSNAPLFQSRFAQSESTSETTCQQPLKWDLRAGKTLESAEAYGIRQGITVHGNYIHAEHVHTGLFVTLFG